MTVRIISRDNGVGLGRDLQLVAGVLRNAGVDVQTLGFGSDKWVIALRQTALRLAGRRVDTQVFLERVYPRCLPLARRNLLIPNPEWTTPAFQAQLARFDRILCKTRHAVDIFDALGCATSYLGFTSEDRLDPAVARERSFFHLAGRSSAKGTQTLLAAWMRHPEWPRLTVVQDVKTAMATAWVSNIDHVVGHLDDARLRRMQNQHQFHLCPSEAEGFGHYLMEGLSVGAIVLATDGAPMNELVTPERGVLIRPARTGMLNLAPRYFVDISGIEAAVETSLQMDVARQTSMGEAARRFFLDNDRTFRSRLLQVMEG
jgi:glycosyltransferase involved in cell wall biosynthesis